jgi:hypothetical protein
MNVKVKETTNEHSEGVTVTADTRAVANEDVVANHRPRQVSDILTDILKDNTKSIEGHACQKRRQPRVEGRIRS